MARMQDQLAGLEENRLAFSAQLIGLSDGTNDLNDSLQQQGARLESARSQVSRLLAEHRRSMSMSEPAEMTALELEAAAIERRNENQTLIDGLTVLAQQDQTLALVLEMRMSEAGVQPPNEAPGRFG